MKRRRKNKTGRKKGLRGGSPQSLFNVHRLFLPPESRSGFYLTLALSYTGIPCMSTKFTQKTYKFSFIS